MKLFFPAIDDVIICTNSTRFVCIDRLEYPLPSKGKAIVAVDEETGSCFMSWDGNDGICVEDDSYNIEMIEVAEYA